ncbi:MAG: ABC transporter permease, partial [Nanoarchaeota archaeon]
VDNAIDTVQGANMTGKGAVLDTLGNVKTKLGAINDMLNGGTAIEGGLNQTGSNTTQTISFSAVTAAVTALQQDLDSAKTKLNTASQAVSSTSTSLSDTSQALQQSLTSLEGVQQKLSEMKAALEAQKVTDAGVLSSPLVTKIEEIGPENTYLNYLFPALLVLAVMFSSLLLGTTLVMMEKNSPAFFRNYFLPLRKGTFVISTYLTTVLITLVQIVIILSVSAIFLKENPLNMLPVAGVLLLSSSVFSFIGMGIGYAFKSEETGTLASISTGSLLLFVSGVVMPLEGISAAMRKITTLNPFVISEKVIRELFIFKNSISSVWGSVAILAGYAVALFLVILIAEYLMHKHFISGFMKHRHLHHRQQERRDKNNV